MSPVRNADTSRADELCVQICLPAFNLNFTVSPQLQVKATWGDAGCSSTIPEAALASPHSHSQGKPQGKVVSCYKRKEARS